MAPTSHAELWNRLNQVSDKITYMEPVLNALKEQANRTDARLEEFEREARGRWEAQTNQMHTLKTDITAELNTVKSEQRVNAAVFGIVFGILTFLGITIVGWTLKNSLDAVRQSITHNQTRP